MRLPSLLRFVALALFGALFLVVVAPGCGRSSLEPETLADAGDSGPPGSCGPGTCPGGCCDANGLCRTGSDPRACGSAGVRCSDCIATGFETCDVALGKVCEKTVAKCGPAECPSGCCNDSGGTAKCLAGTDSSACGGFGARCVDCTQEGRACDPALRACGTGQCDASNCAGCCVGDQCLSGEDLQACGSGGQACASCAAGGQVCAPNAGGGGRCEGVATCGPKDCAGCCDLKGTCIGGTDSSACGKLGQACVDCMATGKQCVPVGQANERTCQAPVTCGPGNCAGCCVGNFCVNSPTNAACGLKGAACKGCAANETCSAGVCTPVSVLCGPGNCASCCVGDVCAVGSQDTACGLGGGACANCAAQALVCTGGACKAKPCGPLTCAGCCSGNTCVTGSQNTACGVKGAACTDCTASNLVCRNQACVSSCGPASCAGCCTGTGTCALGFTDAACGSGGAVCSNCAATASTCGILSSPRVCQGAQSTCPAPYTSCAGSTRTPVTAARQGFCNDTADLDPIRAACAGGPDTAPCIAAFQVLAATRPACASCLLPFNEPFTLGRGIFRCVAPFVGNACNHSTGCVTDCQDVSCAKCTAGNEDLCRDQVDNAGGQCNPYLLQATCIAPALAPGSLCSPVTYANTFGRWLRAVGDHFCGNGP